MYLVRHKPPSSVKNVGKQEHESLQNLRKSRITDILHFIQTVK